MGGIGEETVLETAHAVGGAFTQTALLRTGHGASTLRFPPRRHTGGPWRQDPQCAGAHVLGLVGGEACRCVAGRFKPRRDKTFMHCMFFPRLLPSISSHTQREIP